MIRPSSCNTHCFEAVENTFFFDICVPNTTDQLERKKTYFKVIDSQDNKEKSKNKEDKLDNNSTKLQYFNSFAKFESHITNNP